MWLVRVDFGDDAPGPHRVQQVILADDVLAVLHEIEQQIEDLRPDRNGLGMPGQLPPIRVERIVSEHDTALRRSVAPGA